jgi:hypothetical protein
MRLMPVLAVLLAATTAAAQDTDPPDPSTIQLPDMTPTRDPRVIADGWRHFYFHKAGVAYEEAYRDFRDCYRFLPVPGTSGEFPGFIPWRERPGMVSVQRFNNAGLVGLVIGSLVAGPIERRDRQMRMRRCLEPRGYVRYPLAEEAWRRLIDDYSPRSISLQAMAASGPAPDRAPVTR